MALLFVFFYVLYNTIGTQGCRARYIDIRCNKIRVDR